MGSIALVRFQKSAVGILQFVVRAWITIVMVGYAVLFLVIAIALALKSEDDNGIGDAIGFVFRLLFEALYWTFHPFSPFAYPTYSYDRYEKYEEEEEDPRDKGGFYEKVNRFFFGPPEAKADPKDIEKAIIAQIRAGKGRIGLADVMRVTGLSREEADPMMARLMLDYDGNVEVSDNGGIYYIFESIRKTTENARAKRPPPFWVLPREMPSLTGNTGGTNLMILLLNGFNTLMSFIAIGGGWTVEKLKYMLAGVPTEAIPSGVGGSPLLLGWIPFIFSLVLFAIPAFRLFSLPSRKRAFAEEEGRRNITRVVLEKTQKGQRIDERDLSRAWQEATGDSVDRDALMREIVKLGGDVDVDEQGRMQYRFRDLEEEAAALAAERTKASEREAQVGQVVFSSDS